MARKNIKMKAVRNISFFGATSRVVDWLKRHVIAFNHSETDQ